MKIYENPWKSKNINENPLKCMKIIPAKHPNNTVEPHWVGVNGCMIWMKDTSPRYEPVNTCQTISIQESWIRIVTRTLDTNLGYDTRYEAMIRIQDTNTRYFSNQLRKVFDTNQCYEPRYFSKRFRKVYFSNAIWKVARKHQKTL